MPTKRVSYPVELKALGDTNGDAGRVEAIVSIFNNVDLVGDRVMPGAFAKSIKEWKASGDPVPVVFSHEWGDLWSHIGQVDELEETPKGLRAVYTLDIADNPAAAQTYKLLKRRTLKEHSFAYDVVNERRAKDGANELTELRLIELGPTLKGANPDTELVAVKAALDAQEKAESEPEPLVGSSGTTTTVVSNFTTVTPWSGEKAGARHSQATRSELSSIRDDVAALASRIESLLGDEDTEKTADAPEREAEHIEAEDTKSDSHEPKGRPVTSEELQLRSRIEEMRASLRKN